jgi:hypothetical protein
VLGTGGWVVEVYEMVIVENMGLSIGNFDFIDNSSIFFLIFKSRS